MKDSERNHPLAEQRWRAFHHQLHELRQSRALSAYLARIQMAGTKAEVKQLLFGANGRDANPGKRRMLLRQLAWDVAHGATGASMARALVALLLWSDLDALFGRFRRRFPECDLLPKLVIDALGMAMSQLGPPLEGGAPLDIERDIMAGTLFMTGRLVGDFELRRNRQAARAQDAGYAVLLEDDTEPDGLPLIFVEDTVVTASEAAARDATVSLRAPQSPARTSTPTLLHLPPPPPPPPPAGVYRQLPGSFRVAELAELVDFEHEFRFADAGHDQDGARLVAISIRRPLETRAKQP